MRNIVTAVLFLSTFSTAGIITGTVVNTSRQPLAGATVTLGDETVLTGSDGTFLIGRSASAISRSTVGSLGLTYQKGMVQFSLAAPEYVRFRIYTANGRLVCSLEKQLGAGAHTLHMPEAKNLAASICFFESDISGHNSVHAFSPAEGITLKIPGQLRRSSSALALAVSGIAISKSHHYDRIVSVAGENDTALGLLTLDSAGFGMRQLCGGQFVLGDETGNGASDEVPVCSTAAVPLLMDTIEVTIGEFERLRGFVPEASLGRHNRLPVFGVTWFDAVLYANDRSRSAGLDSVYSYSAASFDGDHCIDLADFAVSYSKIGYRLPTEAEWEWAAKAGTKDLWSFGSDSSRLADAGWYSANSGGGFHEGALKSASVGIYDLYGNVAEWTADMYGVYPDPAQNGGPSSGVNRVVRGGSAADGAAWCRSTVRSSLAPDSLSYAVGFRLVRPCAAPLTIPFLGSSERVVQSGSRYLKTNVADYSGKIYYTGDVSLSSTLDAWAKVFTMTPENIFSGMFIGIGFDVAGGTVLQLKQTSDAGYPVILSSRSVNYNPATIGALDARTTSMNLNTGYQKSAVSLVGYGNAVISWGYKDRTVSTGVAPYTAVSDTLFVLRADSGVVSSEVLDAYPLEMITNATHDRAPYPDSYTPPYVATADQLMLVHGRTIPKVSTFTVGPTGKMSLEKTITLPLTIDGSCALLRLENGTTVLMQSNALYRIDFEAETVEQLMDLSAVFTESDYVQAVSRENSVVVYTKGAAFEIRL